MAGVLCGTRGADAGAPDDSAGWVELLPADHTNVGIIRDLLPPIRAMLDHPATQRVFHSPTWSALMAEGGGLPPERWSGQLDQVAMWWPVEAAFACPDSATVHIGYWIELITAEVLMTGAIEAGDDATAAAIRPGLRRLMSQLDVPRMTLLVRFRDRAAANTVATFALIGLGQAEQLGLNTTVEPEGMRLDAALGDFIDPWTIAHTWVEMGWMDEVDDDTLALAQELAGRRLEVWLHHSEEVLMLTIGPRPGEGEPRLSVDRLGPLYRADASDLMFGRFDLAPLAEAVRRSAGLWVRHADSPAGAQAQANDVDGLLTDLLMFDDQLDAVRGVVSGRLWADRGLEGAYLLEDYPVAEPLVASGLLERIPVDMPVFFATQDQSLADLFAAHVSELEGRLAIKSFGAEFSDAPHRYHEYARMERAYYDHFTPFRDLALLPGDEPFVRSSAVLMDLGEGDFALRTEVWPLAAPAAQRETVALDAARGPRAAWLGRVSDRAAADRHIDALYRALVEGSIGASGAPALEPEELGELRPAVDVGLGRPTRGFETAWTRWVGIALEHHVLFEAGPDLRPHTFFLGDYFVLSTSPRLSRRLIAAWDAAASEPELPESPEPAAGVLRIDGAYLGDLTRWAGDYIDSMHVNGSPYNPAMRQGIRTGTSAMAELFELVDYIEHVAWDDAAGRRGRFVVRTAAEQPR